MYVWRQRELNKYEDMMMVQWMCNVTLKDGKSSDEVRDHLGLVSINWIQRSRLRWFGHLKEWTVGQKNGQLGK